MGKEGENTSLFEMMKRHYSDFSLCGSYNKHNWFIKIKYSLFVIVFSINFFDSVKFARNSRIFILPKIKKISEIIITLQKFIISNKQIISRKTSRTYWSGMWPRTTLLLFRLLWMLFGFAMMMTTSFLNIKYKTFFKYIWYCK